MKRTLYALANAFALCALLSSGSAAARQQQEVPRRPQGPAAGPVIKLPRGEGQPVEPAEDRKAGARRAAAALPQKWEYCAITGVTWSQKAFGIGSSSHVALALVRYFPHGVDQVEGPTEEDAVANAFAKLGDDGWELVAVRESLSLTEGNGRSAPVFYFKRPKAQE